ncbi:hypothetical protein ACRARG_12700 [Pseudooceanicola sp. C21-150M6]|uniref:hypothetical protein n=1 Tax=Pseudooceanicola sp. C21-150M6 TaxID=3434355 RepID=UPI003D7F198A
MPDLQRLILDTIATQVIDDVLDDARLLMLRGEARRRLADRVNQFKRGLEQIGFAPSVGSDPGGRLRITIDVDAWTAPVVAAEAKTDET